MARVLVFRTGELINVSDKEAVEFWQKGLGIEVI